MSARSGHIWLGQDFLPNFRSGLGQESLRNRGHFLRSAHSTTLGHVLASPVEQSVVMPTFFALPKRMASGAGASDKIGAARHPPRSPECDPAAFPKCDPGPRVHRSALRKTIDSRPAGQAGGPVAVPFHPGISSACGPDTASIPARPANRARQGAVDHHTDARDRDL
jgi:hypothetical protein